MKITKSEVEKLIAPIHSAEGKTAQKLNNYQCDKCNVMH